MGRSAPTSPYRIIPPMESFEDVVIVGAGIAGLAAALGLHRLGQRRLVVLESSDTLRASGFAITTWSNAWRALDDLGVGDSLRSRHLRLRRLTATSTISGSVTAQLTLTEQGTRIEEHEARCLLRNVLVETLADELPHGTIRFSSKLVSIERVGELNHLLLADGSTLKTKVVVGCDGINSVVARWLGLKVPTFSGRYAARGLAAFPGGHGLKPEFAQFFGKGYRAGMLPCDGQTVYWFFTWSSPGDEDRELTRDAAQVRQLVLSKMKTAEASEEILHVIESSDLSSVACSPLRYRSPLNLLLGAMSRGSVCAIGDAFHPMTPDLAEGGCSALEDGVLLAKCLGECLRGGGEKRGIEEALKKYARARRWRSFDLVATSSLVGFLQEGGSWAMNVLRDRVLADLLAKKLLSEADFDCGKLTATSF